MKTFFIAAFSLALLRQQAFSQTFEMAKMDQYFDTLAKYDKFMGSVAIRINGEPVYSRSLGFADVEKSKTATAQTKYRIGSISKTFTAVLVMKAIEEKKLKLSDNLSRYYPKIRNADRITIEHMLYHRSGIHSFTDEEDYLSWNTTFQSEQDMVNRMAKAKSKFEPGSKFEYSNPNYVLLSFILQKVYKKGYGEILEEKITKPLGLTNTYFGGKTAIDKNECFSYSFSDNWEKVSETDLSIPMGAGGVVSTPTDIVNFAEQLFAGKIISQASIESMTTLKDGFGKGIFQLPFYENKGFGHTGAIDGFASSFSYFKDSKVAFALIGNGVNMNINDIAIAVLSAAFQKPVTIPQYNAFSVSLTELDQYIGTYNSKDIPLKINVFKEGINLMAQATGQSSMQLEARAKHIFSFDRAGIVIEFNPEVKSLLLKQGGANYSFVKE